MLWFWLALGAAILWGLGYTINQLTLKSFTALELLFFESIMVFLIIGGYFLFRGILGSFFSRLANPRQFLIISGSSLIYLVASMLILKSISSSNASLAAIIEASYPIFTVIFAYLIFGEIQLNAISALGFLLILGGIIIVKIFG